MRTTPFAHWKTAGEKFDETIRGVAESILGFPFTSEAYTQACLTPSLGGLGLRRTVDHADAAFAASFHESQAIAKENWVEPPGLKSRMSDASYKIDSDIQRLVASAPTARERKRLDRICQPHAGAFVTALPSTDDGMDTVMKPQLFRTAVAYRLGVRVVPDETYCPLCQQIIDVSGDHASCCAKNGGLIKRHNRIRNLVLRFCREAHLSPVLEKLGIVQNNPLCRPGDVTLPIWANDRGLAIDVAVTSPFCSSGNKTSCRHLRTKSETRKIRCRLQVLFLCHGF